MQIASVETIPLEHDLGGSRGITNALTATLMKLTNDDGTVGWGEAFSQAALTGVEVAM